MADCDEIICLDSDDSLDAAPVINITRLPLLKQNITVDKSAQHLSFTSGLEQLSRLQPSAQKIADNLARKFSLTSGINVSVLASGETVKNTRVPPTNAFPFDIRHASLAEAVKNTRVPITVQKNTNNFVRNYTSALNKKSPASGELRVPTVSQNTINNYVTNNYFANKRQSTPGETVQNIRVPVVVQNTTNYFPASDKRYSTAVDTTQKAMQNTNVTESTIAWSRNTSNFIKQSMTTAIKPGNKQMLLPTPPTAHQSSYPQLSNARTFMQNNGMAFMPSQSIPCIHVNPIHFEQGYYDQGILRNNFVPNNIPNTNNDFWLKVRLEDLPNRGEVVSQYYFDHTTQTPIQIHNNPPQLNSILQTLDNNKECINKKNVVATNKVQCQTLNTSETLNTNNLKKGKNIVPPFLKRNRSVTTIPMATEIISQRSPESLDNNEVLYVKEYTNIVSTSTSSSLPESTSTQETLQKKELFINTGHDWKKIKTDESNNKIKISNTVSNDSDKQCSQPAKRQKKNCPEPRRNPKRQVQIEKDYMKMLIGSILEPEKERKGRRLALARTSKDKKMEKKTAKRSPRVQPSCGAVFSPPSPLTASHIRKWPTDGMHERPEFDCETGKVVKFDQLIRQIADDYQDKNKTQSGINIKDIGVDKDVSLSALSHDVLHHILSYVASMEKYKKSLKKGVNCNVFDDKIQFFEDLKLVPTIDNSCDTLNNNTDIVDENTDNFSVKDILKNNILLYSLTNNIDQADVAEYIETLNPQDIIHFSNRKFGIEPHVDEDLM